jgi:hypothetical protein
MRAFSDLCMIPPHVAPYKVFRKGDRFGQSRPLTTEEADGLGAGFSQEGHNRLHYAKIRAGVKTLGTMIGANDLFIAAHARSLGLTLVTNSTREFGRVPKLIIENGTLTP